MEITGYILLQIVFWLFFALFACGEAAMLSLNEKKLEELSQNNEKTEEKLKSLHERSTETTAALRLGSMAMGFLAVGFAVYGFGTRLAAAIWRVLLGDIRVEYVMTNDIRWQAVHWAAILIISAIILIVV